MKTIADVIREQFEVPGGYDQLYVRSVEPGKVNQYGFEWPRTPGSTVTTEVDHSNTTGCPLGEGDGFCLATTHAGMSTGIFTARTLLVVAVRNGDIVGSELGDQKIRVRHAMVVACVNGSKLVRRFGSGMSLSRANLNGANLIGARLTGANLNRARLSWANLAGADLAGVNLTGVNLTMVNLAGARLAWARLAGARLAGARLSGANLTRTDLTGANLTWADLSWANLAGADLAGAHLAEARLAGANLAGTDLTVANMTWANIEDAIH